MDLLGPGQGHTYAVSRALYRRLSPYVCPSARDLGDRAAQRLLEECELTMRRIETEPDFAQPGRFLFQQVRILFPVHELLWVRKTIELHVGFARRVVERTAVVPRPCSAYSRAGAPCQREAVNGSDYCPSHRHLALDEPEQIEAL